MVKVNWLNRDSIYIKLLVNLVKAHRSYVSKIKILVFYETADFPELDNI